jgi:8-oxo-dGTP pyrophosphatase MutT (NUDIX family)
MSDPSSDGRRRLPEPFIANARALASGELTPAEPRHASTVVLLRNHPDGMQAYLLRRTMTMAFAAGMYVFPGGSVDPRDQSLDDSRWIGPPPSQWAGLLSADAELAKALVCAAVRETFEESGVLLAGADADSIVDDTTGESWEADRLALIDRSLSFASMLERRGLVLRADLLRPWAHWITPEFEPKRFDTRFFVAALPAGQRTRDVGGEADRVAWVRPAEALAAAESGEMGMLPPTAFTLSEISSYDGIEAVLAAGDQRDIKPVLPKLIVTDDDEARLLLPHDEGYPA